MKTNSSHGRRAAALLLFFALLVTLLTCTAFGASIQDGATTASMTLGNRETILETTTGTRLRACAYTYKTDTNLSGVAYCIDHGLDFTGKTLPISGKYLSSPKTAGVYANGYPSHSLQTFNEQFLADNPVLSGLTENEYAYATQLAIWASLGQLGIEGTEFTVGREFIAQPSGDAQQERVFRAVQLMLKEGKRWDRVYQTGAYIRLSENELGGNISIEADMTLDHAAREQKYGLKRESIGGKTYYTRDYYFASATSTYYNNYNIEVWVDNAPAGTMFTDLSNVELSRGTFREKSTWSAPTTNHYTNINSNGFEYVAHAKLCVPVETATPSGEITVNMGTCPMQYDIYLCENTSNTEQSYIIADPSQGVVTDHVTISWGGVETETGNLEVKKVSDTGLPIAGAEFTLTGEDGTSRTGVSNDEGIVRWVELNPRVHYVLTETKAPAGFGIVGPTDITVSAAKTNYVTITDSVVKRLTVHKQDAQNGYSLQGCVFTFEQIDGDFKTDRTTDHAGNIQLSAEDLPIGSYRVYEKAACDGYELDSTPQTIHWDGLRDVTLTFRDVRKKTLVIYKCSEGNKYALPHAVFDVYKDGEFVCSVETNDAGLAYVSGVTSGYWECKERVAPEGYALNPEKYGIRIDNYDPATTDDPRIIIPDKQLPTLRIVKYDQASGKPMANIIFAVSCDGVFLGNYKTDSAGEILVTDHEGTFLVVEVESDDDHIVCSDPQQIELKAGDGTRALYFFNSKKPGMHLVKLDEADLFTPIPNAKFRFEAVDGTWGPQELTTGADGTIDLSKLPVKAFVVTELDCPGYVIDNAKRIIELKPNENVEFVFTNSKEPALHLKKLSSDGSALAGVAFRLVKIEDGSHYLDRTTDSNGEILWEGLEPGVYSLTETATLSTHILNTKEYHVEVFPGKVSEIVIENDVRPNLIVYKKDADSGVAVPNTVFLVKAADGHSVDEIKTDSTGKAELKNLLPGVYEISEKSVPSPYLLDAPSQLVTLYPNRDHTAFFYNHQKAVLTVRKISSGVNATPIAGAKFHVTYASNETRTGEINDLGYFTTGKDGTFTIHHQKDGWYRVEEVAPSRGYTLADPAYQDFFLKAGESKTITFENAPLSNLVILKRSTDSKKPLEGVQFKITYADGSFVDTSDGTLSSNGIYFTDKEGQIKISGIVGTVVVTEEKTIDGYTMDENTRAQTVTVYPDDTQTLYFYNEPVGGVEIIKVSEAKRSQRLSNATFEIRRMDGGLVTTVTTDKLGRCYATLENGAYYCLEVQAPDGFKLDSTPSYFEVIDGRTTTVTVTNKPFSGILLHKYSTTGEDIYGATFLLYDGGMTPIGQYTTDQRGLIYIDGLVKEGHYYLRELSNEGYVADTQIKTVYVKAGETTTVEWANTPIRGQIQIIKRSADNNTINGFPRGTPLAGAVFEIYDKSGNVVDTIHSDDRGRAMSKLLPLSRYTIREVKAPANYSINPTILTAYLEYQGQIVIFDVEDESVSTGVSISKTGPAEVVPGQPIRYTLSGIANTSTVPLESFYWRDSIPAQVTAAKLVTGTYNYLTGYKVIYHTNLSQDYMTLADNLSTAKNYVLDLTPAALGLAANEKVTEVMFVFGQVGAGFAQVETPYLHGTVLPGLVNGSAIVNVADVGGIYDGQWVQAVARWVTTVYAKTTVQLPKTGY